MNTAPVILIGGGGLGPWAWERTTPILRANGFDVHTPQLSATGDDQTPAAEVTMRTWIDDLSTYIEQHRLSGVALVAHSFAGYIAAGLLERDPTTVDTAIFIDAALPEPGRSWFDTAGPETRAFMESLAADEAIPWFTKDQLDQVYPGHGFTDADDEWIRPRLTAQPIGTYTEPAIQRPIAIEAVHAIYLRCTRSTPPAAPIDSETPGWAWRTLDAGHWPMITTPRKLADALTATLRRTPPQAHSPRQSPA